MIDSHTFHIISMQALLSEEVKLSIEFRVLNENSKQNDSKPKHENKVSNVKTK